MTSELFALSFDAHEPMALARFWAGVLGWQAGDGADLEPRDDTGIRLRFRPTTAPKTTPNRIHFDLTSQSVDDQQRTVDRALSMGACHIDVGQRPEEGHVVLADPEGNEFCVVGPGNNFLADCGFLGALSGDGSQAAGYFWSQALCWPLVWDQDEETAIRSPRGGPKITWGGPPVNPKVGRNRLRFELATTADGDQQAEVDRLLALGATRIDDSLGGPGAVALADPDGNEFCLFPARP
jgi:predicted enzyme related to lactoylglutathione lyase